MDPLTHKVISLILRLGTMMGRARAGCTSCLWKKTPPTDPKTYKKRFWNKTGPFFLIFAFCNF